MPPNKFGKNKIATSVTKIYYYYYCLKCDKNQAKGLKYCWEACPLVALRDECSAKMWQKRVWQNTARLPNGFRSTTSLTPLLFILTNLSWKVLLYIWSWKPTIFFLLLNDVQLDNVLDCESLLLVDGKFTIVALPPSPRFAPVGAFIQSSWNWLQLAFRLGQTYIGFVYWKHHRQP